MATLGIIDRYIGREVARTWGGVTVVLLLILVSNSFARYLGDAAAGKLPADAVLVLAGLAALKYLMIVMPVGLFLGIMLALGRLYSESEMTAMRACGVSTWQVYRPVMLFSLIIALGLAVLSLGVSPWVATKTDMVRQNAKQQAKFTHFQAGSFKRHGDNGVFYSQSVSPDGRLLGVFALRLSDDGSAQLVTATDGVQQADGNSQGQLLVLQDGYRYEGVPGQADFRIADYRSYGIRIRPKAVSIDSDELETTPTVTLWGMASRAARAERQWRIVIPLSVLVLAFFAVPLSRTRPRQGRYGKLFAAILVYITYQNVAGVARVWVEKGIAPALVGLWWVPILAVIWALVLLWKQRELRRYHRSVEA